MRYNFEEYEIFVPATPTAKVIQATHPCGESFWCFVRLGAGIKQKKIVSIIQCARFMVHLSPKGKYFTSQSYNGVKQFSEDGGIINNRSWRVASHTLLHICSFLWQALL